MPEYQVSTTINDTLSLGKGMDPGICPENQRYRLEVVPITNSKKKNNLIVSKPFTWTSPTDKPGWQTYAPNHSWIERAEESGLRHLMGIVPYAPLICRTRGKLGCFAAGPHAIVVVYALQSNVIGMPIKTYRSIIATDYPGPNRDSERASKELRVFKIPEEYIVPYSSPQQRTIKIFAAFVSEEWAWVFNDFNSLITIRIFSRDEPWTADDLSPGTKEWTNLFGSVKKGGPDWICETQLAKHNLHLWRKKIMDEYHKGHFQQSLLSYWQKSSFDDTQRAITTNPTVSYKSLFRPIISELLDNRCNSFAGIGNYSANDLLHHLAIYPFTPSHLICEDNDIFNHLEEGIHHYLMQFSTPEFLNRASSIPNTNNPFSFNEHYNNEFLSKWVIVYQRTKAKVPIKLYNKLVTQGLLNDEHIIGTSYSYQSSEVIDKQKKFVYLPVVRCKGPDGEYAYTVIKAKPPDEWGLDIEMDDVDVDIKQFSFRPTIGPSQFLVHVQNQPNYNGIEPGILAVGRPLIKRTGKAGRPRKGLSSKKRLERYSKNYIGRCL